MSEYIEREAALEICETEYQNRLRMLDYCGDTVAWNIGSEIKALPAADVAPVVHGRWDNLDGYKTRMVCSVCGWDVPEYGKFYSYCPNCGAKMDGDSNG
jgi:hypothetical protein